jgi:LysM repeat protein
VQNLQPLPRRWLVSAKTSLRANGSAHGTGHALLLGDPNQESPMILAILVSCTNPQPARPTAVELTDTTLVETAPPPELPVAESVPEEAPVAIESPPEPPSVSIDVRSGESLVLLADFAHVRAEDVADLNGVDLKDAIVPGQTLKVPTADAADFAARRDAWLAGKVERYLSRRGGVVGLSDRRVGTGDTAWSIAREQGRVPMWIVEYYNPNVDLDRLGIGDKLTLPVFADTVAEAAVDGVVE